MNTELFQKIRDVIAVEPERFDMSSWEEDNTCGTTRCMAGWAVHLTTDQPLYVQTGDPDERATLHPTVEALADRLGVGPDMEDIGGAVLGLSREEAQVAFYVSETRAKQFIDLAAAGRDVEALSLLDY